MDVPSMVQRAGDTLIVRSVVSGNQIYLDQGTGHVVSNPIVVDHLERFRLQQQQQEQQQHQHHQQQQQQQPERDHHHQGGGGVDQAHELKDEGLPQCKIKRNYSCTYCTYFTQNPRYHLTHLRDIHGEKIVINKCKLCLYASRHYQKLVRHMKMVHGSTEGIAGHHGQTRKRGMNREARKRKLENNNNTNDNNAAAAAVGLLQHRIEQQAREHLLQQQQHAAAAAAAAEAAQRERERERERELERDQQEQQQQYHQQRMQREQQLCNNNFQMPPQIDTPPTPPDNLLQQNRLLKCSVCEFTTLYRAQLLDHELEEHCKTQFFRCEKCSYVTHVKTRFSKHVKYHSMPMIKCVTCDFRTPYKWNLDRHMKNHGGAGPFKCAACDFTADIKQSLTVHEMNHHVPPVGHAAGMSLARRRNKVGGTDVSDDFLSDTGDLLDDHFINSLHNNNNNNCIDDFDDAMMVAAATAAYGKKCKYDDDEEQPTDLSQKGSDTSSVHNSSTAAAAAAKSKSGGAIRPVPNLIPIPKSATTSSALNLSKDLAAPPRSSLKEIASLFLTENQISEIMDKSDVVAQLSPTTSSSSHSGQSRIPAKKVSGSLFDKLKASALLAAGGRNENLICSCGHIAKCLSESIIHRKTCKVAVAEDAAAAEIDDQYEMDGYDEEDDKHSHQHHHHAHSSASPINLSVNCSSASGGLIATTCSIRCQHCRHRCKSSADLLNHLKNCSEAGHDSFDSMSGDSSGAGGHGGGGGVGHRDDESEDMSKHPMENRVFVWNKMPGSGGDDGGPGNAAEGNISSREHHQQSGSTTGSSNGKNDENSYYGVETAPGYGEMTAEEEAANSSLKKVYKCPHCSFWASTASRFHVHIVGHLNKKPFECSLCAYRSNWRWDITKHIRLKTIRDPSHKNARVLMNDETGRRNYTKYNKYITLMKVTEEDGDPKLMKSGEMTPNQVASLAFLNDYNKSGGGGGSSSSGSVSNGGGIKIGGGCSSVDESGGNGNAQTEKTDSETNINADDLMRLPLIASAMMNAAIAQQEQQQHQISSITPSVTISAVKRSPPPLIKPSDDLVTDIKQDGGEKKTFYKCRKCNFRHSNRDAVLAHVKGHYQEANMSFAAGNHHAPPAVSLCSSPKTTNQLHHSTTTPLQIAVNSNHYINKVFAAMCLSQQQQQQQQQHGSSSIASNATPPPPPPPSTHSIFSAAGGLLQQAISPNSPLGGLALALASSASSSAISSAAATVDSNSSPLSNSNNNIISNNNNNNNSSSSSSSNSSPTVEHGELIMMVNNTNKSNNERHCRLKHNGDIRIETLDRSNNDRSAVAAVYRPLGCGSSNDNTFGQTFKSIQQQQQLQHHPNNNNNNNSVLISNMNKEILVSTGSGAHAAGGPINNNNSSDSVNIHAAAAAAAYLAAYKTAHSDDLQHSHFQQMKQNDQIEITRIPPPPPVMDCATNNNNRNSSPSTMQLNNSNSKCKQQKCPSCPYISESKSQMNYHISLHKPTQYECSMCTFVCAKKQHLSSHMRTVHSGGAQCDFAGGVGPGATGADAIAIDLRSSKQSSSYAVNEDDGELFKFVSYCGKCPARFTQHSSKEFHDHLKAHGGGAGQQSPPQTYRCEVCDFTAQHETQLQTHSFVHTSSYQEKCEQMTKNCKEDPEYPAPRLMQITLAKASAAAEPIWVVDNDLSAGIKQQQHSSVSSSGTGAAAYDNQNSLLKKQLEQQNVVVAASATHTTNSSHSQFIVDSSGEAEDLEKCTYCPFQSTNAQYFKSHLQHHICISNSRERYTCEHCDFSAKDESLIAEHTRVHFGLLDNLKSVAFFTSYDNLELSVFKEANNNNSNKEANNNNNNNNDESAVNENATVANLAAVVATHPTKKPTKVVLYKNDTGKDLLSPASSKMATTSSTVNNISDRLRRRSSRSSNCQVNGSSDEAQSTSSPQQQQQSHKTILVNAKTGQVISRN